MNKIRISYVDANGLMSYMPIRYDRIEISGAYLDPGISFSVQYYGDEMSKIIVKEYKRDLRCIIYLNDIPFLYGFIHNRTISHDKTSGIVCTLHFRSLLGQLEKFSIDPLTSFTGAETLDQIVETVLNNDWNIYNNSGAVVHVTSDKTKFSYIPKPIQHKLGNGSHKTKRKVIPTDLQPTAGISIYAFLQKILHRHGLHLCDGIAFDGQPCLFIDSQDFEEIKVYDMFSITNTKNFVMNNHGSNSLVEKVVEKIENTDLHAFYLFWGSSYGSFLSQQYKAAPMKSLRVNPLFQDNPRIPDMITALSANFNLNLTPADIYQLMEHDGWYQYLYPFLDRFDTSNIKPCYRQESECTSEQEMNNKLAFVSALDIYNAYTLTYDLVNIGQSYEVNNNNANLIYMPGIHTTVNDETLGLENTFMFVNSVRTSIDKSSGIKQTVELKIPGSIVLDSDLY